MSYWDYRNRHVKGCRLYSSSLLSTVNVERVGDNRGEGDDAEANKRSGSTALLKQIGGRSGKENKRHTTLA
jgi:hypothetical protein